MKNRNKEIPQEFHPSFYILNSTFLIKERGDLR